MTDPTPADTIAPGTPRAEGVLLPCPFCGGNELAYGYTHPGREHVICYDCDAVIFTGTEAEAIAAWNRRAPALSVQAAAQVLLEHIHPSQACCCMGPQGDDPLCPCAMKDAVRTYLLSVQAAAQVPEVAAVGYLVNIRGATIVGTQDGDMPDGTYQWVDELPSAGGMAFGAALAAPVGKGDA